MSHELRTPLNSIIGFSEILQDNSAGDLNERQREYVGYIHDSGMHLLRLIGEILDLSKAEAGKLNLELCRVLLMDILMAALNMQKEKAMTHGISLSLEMGADRDVEIVADPLRLKQIVYNLLSNAVKFTPDGGSVRIRSKVVSQETGGIPDEYVEISIEDTGIGIRPEDMKNLFKGFTQLNSPYADKFEGAGLGLALSKQLVELHGGRIWATSEYGRGSTFTFLIPKRGATAP
jgi:signal transduction histidine kinase